MTTGSLCHSIFYLISLVVAQPHLLSCMIAMKGLFTKGVYGTREKTQDKKVHKDEDGGRESTGSLPKLHRNASTTSLHHEFSQQSRSSKSAKVRGLRRDTIRIVSALNEIHTCSVLDTTHGLSNDDRRQRTDASRRAQGGLCVNDSSHQVMSLSDLFS